MKRWTVLFLLLPVLFLSACARKKDVKCEVILEEIAREIGGLDGVVSEVNTVK